MSVRIRRFSETIENIETVFANHHKNHKQNEWFWKGHVNLLLYLASTHASFSFLSAYIHYCFIFCACKLSLTAKEPERMLRIILLSLLYSSFDMLISKLNYMITTKATDFKSLWLKFWEINQATPKCQIDFLEKTCKKGLK